MRIISGKYKGKKIFLPKDKGTRPLKDLVKESIFNLLEHSNKIDSNIINSNILDLFSGSGSFGLECVSRGAKNVFFVENYEKAIEILKKNILELKSEKICQIIQEDCFRFLKSIKKIDERFDFIFIDPPYKEKNINLIINIIKQKKILKDNGIIILHRHKKDSIIIDEILNILDERFYGLSKIVIGN